MTNSNLTKIRSVLAAAALLSAGGLSHAATYYVAVNGSNSNPGTSASPFLTIQRGVDAAAAGDTVIVRDGNYAAGASINKAGSPSAWITIKAEHKWKAVLNCSVSCHDHFGLGGSSAYIVIQDFDIGFTKNAGVFSNSGGGRNIRVLGNHIHDIGTGVYDSTPYGLMGVYTDASAANWTIDGNVVHDCGRMAVLTGSHDHGLYLHGTNMVVSNNVFYRVPNGWHIQTAAGFSGTIVNNTFFGSDMYPGKNGAMTLWDPNSNVIIRNNVFYNPIGWAIVTYTLSMTGACSIDHNIVYSEAGSVGLIDSMPSACASSANLINVNPLLTTPSLPAYDFHLKAGSPAINAGSASAAPPLDFDGAARPQGGAYDLGAFEYGGTVPLPVADVTPPVISGVAASAVSQAGATIGWATNEASDTQVEYGPTTAYGASTVLNSTLTTSHSAVLTGLSAGTLYHYRVKSKDAAGNLATSPDQAFTTAATTLPAGCFTSAGAWQNTALAAQTGSFTLEFDATPATASMDGVSGPSNGTAADYNALAVAAGFSNAGTLVARNGGGYSAASVMPYVAGLTYHFRLVIDIPSHTYSAYVKQGTNAEQLLGSNYAFRTEQAAVTTLNNLGMYAATGSQSVCAVTAAAVAAADTTPPVIGAVAASGLTQTGAAIGWSTNEASDTQVEYGPTAAYGASTVLNSTLSTSHSAALSGLTAGTLYHYRAKSKDAAGNLATSADATFTTLAAAPGAGCFVSAGAWQNTALAAQTGAFTLEFDAVPGAARMDGVSGPSNGTAGDYNALAVAAGFSSSGYLVARNGGAYAAASQLPYAAGQAHHFRLVISIPSHTYSAYVRQGTNPEVLLGSNYAFRTEQAAVTTLNNLGMYAATGSQSVCAAAVTAAVDVTPPLISAVSASAVTQTGATIGWSTNEASDTQVEYGPTTAYGASTVLNTAMSTSHGAAVGGLAAGTLYHYRARSRDAAGNLATSADATVTTSAPVPVVACVNSAGAWANAPLAPQTGSFTVEFDATPSAANIDGVSGLSYGTAADYTKLAAIVRFNNAGKIDARNGGVYTAASAIPYAAGLTYHFRLAVSLSSRKYSAYVKQGANAELLIGGDYSFRTEQAALSNINNLGVNSSAGSEKICDATVK